MLWPALKYFGGLCMFLLSKDLKIDKDVAFFYFRRQVVPSSNSGREV